MKLCYRIKLNVNLLSDKDLILVLSFLIMKKKLPKNNYLKCTHMIVLRLIPSVVKANVVAHVKKSY
jgi:hypothetical protein